MYDRLGAIIVGVASVSVSATVFLCLRKRGAASVSVSKEDDVKTGLEFGGKTAIDYQTEAVSAEHNSVDKRKIQNASCITSSTTWSANTRTTLDSQRMEEVVAKLITFNDLAKQIDDKDLLKTVSAVVSELCNLRGGALIVIYECPKRSKDRDVTLPISYLDNGGLMKVFKRHAKNIFSEGSVNPGFRGILEAFTSVPHEGSQADKWERPILEHMSRALGQSWSTAEDVRALLHGPADGALAILSLRGTVVAAAAMICISPVLVMIRPDGKSTGTRHTAAVSAVEWCRLHDLQGAAVVRSDAGHVSVLCICDGKTSAFQITA